MDFPAAQQAYASSSSCYHVAVAVPCGTAAIHGPDYSEMLAQMMRLRYDAIAQEHMPDDLSGLAHQIQSPGE